MANRTHNLLPHYQQPDISCLLPQLTARLMSSPVRLPAYLSLTHWSGPSSLLIGRLCFTYGFSSLLRPPSLERLVAW